MRVSATGSGRPAHLQPPSSREPQLSGIANCKVDGSILALKVSMRRLLSIATIFLLLTAAAPVLACVTGVAMSHEESACCRAMHGQCGAMAKQGCCRTEIRVDSTPGIATTPPAIGVHWICVAQSPALASPMRALASDMRRLPDEQPPLGLLTATITVLRI